jgi:hypothetical protein
MNRIPNETYQKGIHQQTKYIMLYVPPQHTHKKVKNITMDNTRIMGAYKCIEIS